MAKKVFVVDAGAYSDNHIVAVCATADLAREYVNLYNEDLHHDMDAAAFSEWKVLDRVPGKFMHYRRSVQVVMDGSEVQERYPNEYQYAKIGAKPKKITNTEFLTYDGRIDIHVEGGDKAYVDKAFYDRVAQAKAILLGVG